MSAITFDTHTFDQASLIEERLATKRDLAELEARLRADNERLELRLTIRLGTMLAAAVAVVAALVKLL